MAANDGPAAKRKRLDDQADPEDSIDEAAAGEQLCCPPKKCAAAAFSSATADDVIPSKYDEEDLDEDVEDWLDSNYAKSKAGQAGCKSAAAAMLTAVTAVANNNEGDDGTKGDDFDDSCAGPSAEGAQDEEEFENYQKTVLVEKGKQHFDDLPDGWVEVTHDSGMPVYLDKVHRVCVLARPYFLGPGSVRKHDIPLASVPCLQYRREQAKSESGCISTIVGKAGCPSIVEAEAAAENLLAKRSQQDNVNEDDDILAAGETIPCRSATARANGIPQPKASIETAGEETKKASISADVLHDYCKNLFEFKKISIKKFKTWRGRREYARKHRPQMPPDATLIVCSAADLPAEFTSGTTKKADLVLNPKGKTYICILHEYLQWAMKTKPTYTYRETENSTNPFCATVNFGEVNYGVGYGANKKNAKSDAARKTLAILLPHAIQKIEAQANSWENMKPLQDTHDVTFFDTVKVEDSRLNDLCKKAGQPSPYAVLLECLKRNYMMGDTDVKIQSNVIATAKVEVTLTVGKHTAGVMAKNKKLGKQLASQKLLQKLHPHITCWGSIVRLYGTGSIVSVSERKGPSEDSSSDNSIVGESAIFQTTSDEAPVLAACRTAVQGHVNEEEHMESQPSGHTSQIFSPTLANELLMMLPDSRPICHIMSAPEPPLSRVRHQSAACQTSWYGYSMLHKATQHPDMSYSPFTNKNVVRSLAGSGCSESSPKAAGCGLGCSASSQTDFVGHSLIHKATQHPDVGYGIDESSAGGGGERCLPQCPPTAPQCWGAAAAFGPGNPGGIPLSPGIQPFGSSPLPPQFGLQYMPTPYYLDASYPMPMYPGYGPVFHSMPPPSPYDY